jgi:hypothetical protein
MFIQRVIGPGKTGVAILLQTRLAVRAGAVRVNHAAHGCQVSGFETLYFVAHRGHAAHNLMSGHRGISCVLPFIADRVQVRVAYAAVEHF